MNKEKIINHLIDWWKEAELDFFKISFKNAMEKLGIPKKDMRYKEQGKCYDIWDDGGRISCNIWNNNKDVYGQQIFEIVLRKEWGNYLIISHNQNRVFEVDYHGLRKEQGNLLDCYNEYKELFEIVFDCKEATL